jgi:hypothetical protein
VNAACRDVGVFAALAVYLFIVRRIRCQLVRLRKYRRRTGVPREVERGLAAAAGSDHARTWAYVHEPFRKFARQATLHAGACVRAIRRVTSRAISAHARVYV